MLVPFTYDFRSLSINFSTTFGIWVCHISLPKLDFYSWKKEP